MSASIKAKVKKDIRADFKTYLLALQTQFARHLEIITAAVTLVSAKQVSYTL